MRIVVIGARRVRQGIGEFVAQSFHRAGAEVVGVVGTGVETAELARANLKERYDIRCRGYARLEDALESETPDAVAICSPMEHHAAQLAIVARAGCHCLCEKPLFWRNPPSEVLGSSVGTHSGDARGGWGAALVDEIAPALSEFVARGRLLELITQWPETLSGYYRLYPAERTAPLRSLSMTLGPPTMKPASILDAFPHVLSMLLYLVGFGSVGSPRANWGGATRRGNEDPGEMRVDFEYKPDPEGPGGETAATPVEVRCRFVRSPTAPRPAGYALNGHAVTRGIRLPEYDMFLETASFGVPESGVPGSGARGSSDEGQGPPRVVELEDPLGLRVAAFLEAVERGCATDRRRLEDSVSMLVPLVGAVEQLWKNDPGKEEPA